MHRCIYINTQLSNCTFQKQTKKSTASHYHMMCTLICFFNTFHSREMCMFGSVSFTFILSILPHHKIVASDTMESLTDVSIDFKTPHSLLQLSHLHNPESQLISMHLIPSPEFQVVFTTKMSISIYIICFYYLNASRHMHFPHLRSHTLPRKVPSL